MGQNKKTKSKGRYTKPMSSRKKTALLFLFGFALFAAVFVTAGAATLYLSRQKSEPPPADGRVANSVPGSMSILLAGGNSPTKRTAFFLVKLDGEQSIATIQKLDTQKSYPYDGKKLMLAEHYQDKGAQQVVEVLGKEDIDRYISFDMTGVATVVDQMGGLIFDVPAHSPLPKGRQKLAGSEVKELLEAPDLELSGKLLQTFLNQCLTQENMKNLEDYFLLMVRNTTTDITAGDLYKLRDVLNAIAEHPDSNKVFLLDEHKNLIP